VSAVESVVPSAAPRARLAIVEDHELLAESLAFALARQGFDAVIVAPLSEDEVIARLETLEPQVVLLDLHLGDVGSALPIIEPLRARGIRVVMMTGETSRSAWGECIEAGASAVVSKTAPFDELLDRIARLASGEDAMPRGEREDLLASLRAARLEERVRLEPFRRLSVRECEVLADLMDGLSADSIADAAFVSVTTVRSHIRSILRKLDVSSQLAAVAMAVRAGWSSPHRRPAR
jgi:DNA-binding NarL/FixJ family response regulator